MESRTGKGTFHSCEGVIISTSLALPKLCMLCCSPFLDLLLCQLGLGTTRARLGFGGRSLDNVDFLGGGGGWCTLLVEFISMVGDYLSPFSLEELEENVPGLLGSHFIQPISIQSTHQAWTSTQALSMELELINHLNKTKDTIAYRSKIVSVTPSRLQLFSQHLFLCLKAPQSKYFLAVQHNLI